MVAAQEETTTPKGDTVETTKTEPQRIVPEKIIPVRVHRVVITYADKVLKARRNKAGEIIRPAVSVGELLHVEVQWSVIGSEKEEKMSERAETPADCRALLKKIGLSK